MRVADDAGRKLGARYFSGDGIKYHGIRKPEFADPFFTHPFAQKFFCLGKKPAPHHGAHPTLYPTRLSLVGGGEADPERVIRALAPESRHGTQ